MANRLKAVAENVAGNFYVDSTCIDCGTCRHVAPDTFDETDDGSFVYRQPLSDPERRAALRALLACPVGSIGSDAKEDLNAVCKEFPLPVTDNVYYCGFTSSKSYGASSYFIEHPAGNWLVDSPKFLPQLVSCFEKKGGIRHIFLTHSDDVADADRYASHFGAERIFHEADVWSQPGTERVLKGEDPVQLLPDFRVVPTPGHTRGHCVLLYRDKILFSGDHLWWEAKNQCLGAPVHILWNRTCLVESLEKLLAYSFEWVLPGHGAPVRLSPGEMSQALESLVSRLKKTP